MVLRHQATEVRSNVGRTHTVTSSCRPQLHLSQLLPQPRHGLIEQVLGGNRVMTILDAAGGLTEEVNRIPPVFLVSI
jgi:hypothetical protein